MSISCRISSSKKSNLISIFLLEISQALKYIERWRRITGTMVEENVDMHNNFLRVKFCLFDRFT